MLQGDLPLVGEPFIEAGLGSEVAPTTTRPSSLGTLLSARAEDHSPEDAAGRLQRQDLHLHRGDLQLRL